MEGEINKNHRGVSPITSAFFPFFGKAKHLTSLSVCNVLCFPQVSKNGNSVRDGKGLYSDGEKREKELIKREKQEDTICSFKTQKTEIICFSKKRTS